VKKQISSAKLNEIIDRFSYHDCDEEAVKKMQEIRQQVRRLAITIEALCPNAREKNTALTLLASVMMQANASIVLTHPIAPTEQKYIDHLVLEMGLKDLD
jgi:hypothetical protein